MPAGAAVAALGKQRIESWELSVADSRYMSETVQSPPVSNV
jgi:hypothetical protein